jgi:hypothetical protein
MSLVLKITNPTGTASNGIAANKSYYFQLNDSCYAITGDDDTTITSAVVGSTTYVTTTLELKVGHLGRHGNFDELLSS